jgi:hypothetical protein
MATENVPFEISHFMAPLVLRRSANAGKSGEKPLVRQQVESAGKTAQYCLVARPSSDGRRLSNG